MIINIFAANQDSRTMDKIKKGRTSDLIPDDKNFNKHTESGKKMLRKSLKKFGFGRSILVDKNNRIIGGNGVVEMSGDVDTITVETTGEELVIVKRNDIDLDSKIGREMALADNATAAADLDWDFDTIAGATAEWELDAQEWGIAVDANEMPLNELNKDPEEKPFAVRITFDSQEKLNDFRRKFEPTIISEFNALVSISGGLL